MIGREKEKQELLKAYTSEYSEFVAVYGRRRVGKTFLVRETFSYKFTFEHSGNSHAPMRQQLEAWHASLTGCGWKDAQIPKTWLEAFGMLIDLIKKSKDKKKVIFIDEMPWMDTPKSYFVSALEYFWNSFATSRKDILLIICGSATSWIINKIIKDHGGLHNRVTRQIMLQPFTLRECLQFSQDKELGFDEYDVMRAYMILGGIPFYWSLLEKGKSIDGNIDDLFFNPSGNLHSEFDNLYDSLFRAPEGYIKIVTALGKKKIGMSRNEIIKESGIEGNGRLSRLLRDLEYCGFIRSYRSISEGLDKNMYQLIDNFTIFYFKFMQENREDDPNFWSHSIGNSRYKTWCGLAFERVCYQHTNQIKKALGINGVASNIYAWKADSDSSRQGAQIDMVIDRADHVANLCEMKFSESKFRIDKGYYSVLQNKSLRLRQTLKKSRSIFITIITPYGLENNAYSANIQNVICCEDLFA